MKLFLSSSASYTLDLILPLLPKNPTELKVAFITTAADPYPEKSWMYADRDKLVAMGFTVADYDLKGKKVDILRKDLSAYQIIFVSGGNTFYLLNEVRKSGFDIVIKELVEKDIIYIGSSAGSCLVCPTIEHLLTFDDAKIVPELTDYTGLGFVNQLILPHYGLAKYADRQASVLEKYGNKILPLRDDQAAIVNGSELEVVTNKESHATENH